MSLRAHAKDVSPYLSKIRYRVLRQETRKESPNNTFVPFLLGLPRLSQRQDLYDIMNTRLFQDYSDIDTARFRLLSKAKD
jgi:hypothetical protein